MLLYLNRLTFVGQPAADTLAAEVRAARAAKIPILLLHENDPNFGGCNFSRFFYSTPDDLIQDGLYSDIAVALYSTVEEMAVSRSLAVASLVKMTSGTKKSKQTRLPARRRQSRRPSIFGDV
jgi:hypothetical protein